MTGGAGETPPPDQPISNRPLYAPELPPHPIHQRPGIPTLGVGISMLLHETGCLAFRPPVSLLVDRFSSPCRIRAHHPKEHGLPSETEASIKAKLRRGTFTATFLLATLAALGMEALRLDDI